MFQIFKLSCCFDYLKLFILRSNHFDPLIFLIQHLYISLFRQFPYSSIVFLAAVISIPLTQRNYFFYVGVFILPSLPKPLSLINIMFGILSCNQYWKVLLFVYSLANFLTFQYYQSWNLINIVTLIVYCIIIYSRFVFRNISQNKKYFMGFFCLSVVYSINLIFASLSISIIQYYQLYIVLISISILASHSIIKKRIWQLTNSTLQNLTSGSEVINYIQLIIKRAKQNSVGLYQTHISNCKYSDCFCKSQLKDSYLSFVQLLVISIFQQAILKFKDGYFHDYVYHAYLEYLNQQQLFLQASQNLIRFKTYSKSIFNYIKQEKISIAIIQYFKTIHSQGYKEIGNINVDECFQYQRKIQELRKKIIQLIHLKVQFWEEITKPHSKVVILKNLGSQFLKKLNNIHIFYQKQIKLLEKQMMSTVGGIIYNLFLLTATNYKEHAETNIKQLKKCTNQRGNVKTYVYGIIKVSLNQSRLGIIEDINNTALKLLCINTKKFETLGKSVNFMVPQSYKRLHNMGMLKLKKTNKSSLIGNQLDLLPIVTMNNTTLPCSLIFKYSNNIGSQISLITIIKYYRTGSQFVLLNGNDKIELMNSNKFDSDIIKLKQVQTIIKNFRTKWSNIKQGQNYSINQPVQIHFKYLNTNYICTISSPMSNSFVCPSKPPLHLFFSNGSSTFQDLQYNQIQNSAIQKFKHILDHQSDSQTLTNGKKQQIIDVLQNFKKNSSLRLFNYYYPIVILIAILGISFVTIEVMLIKIDWLDMNNTNNNVFQLLSTHYNIQSKMLQTMSKGLSIYGINNGYLTNQKYSQTYGVPNYYNSTFDSIFSICQNFGVLNQAQINQNHIVQNSDYSQFKYKNVQFQTSTITSNIPFYILLSVFRANCYQLAKQKDLQQTVLGQIFWKTITQNYYDLREYIKTYMFNRLSQFNTLNYPILVVMICIFIFCLLFVYFGNKRIQKQEDYVFELIASIPLDYITQQVNTLTMFEISLRSNSLSNTLQNQQNNALNESQNMRLKKQFTKKWQKRTRDGQLDTNESRRPRILFYLMVSVFIVFLIGILLIKNQEVKTLKESFHRIIEMKQWKNQRLGLLVYIKKYLFQFNCFPNTNLSRSYMQQLSDKINNELTWRKQNYVDKDSSVKFQYNCSLNSSICLNGTLSQQSLNIYFQSIITSTFIMKSVQNIPIQQLLEQTSSNIVNYKQGIIKTQLKDKMDYYFWIGQVLLIVSWIFFLFLLVMIVIYVNNLKQQYIRLTLFISLLNQEMITKSKRVQSFISRLGTHEQ